MKALVFHDGPDRRRRLGSIVHRPEGATFCKTLRGSVHLFRALDAWAMQAEVLDDLRLVGVRAVEVRDSEAAITYRADLAVFERDGITRDFGHGPQVFLPRKFWQTESAEQPRLPFASQGARP
jgi:hypothetical protein